MVTVVGESHSAEIDSMSTMLNGFDESSYVSTRSPVLPVSGKRS
jgi:hypothetical protein